MRKTITKFTKPVNHVLVHQWDYRGCSLGNRLTTACSRRCFASLMPTVDFIGNGMEAKPYLRDIELKRDDIESFEEYPFCLPVVREMDCLTFHPDVTFFVGENGTGESTLIEAIATAMGLNPEGGNKNTMFATEETHTSLNEYIKTVKSYKKPKDYYFLRAESFYNVATYMDSLVPPPTQGYGGKSLHHQSHGEAFMAVLAYKLRGNGLYFM